MARKPSPNPPLRPSAVAAKAQDPSEVQPPSVEGDLPVEEFEEENFEAPEDSEYPPQAAVEEDPPPAEEDPPVDEREDDEKAREVDGLWVKNVVRRRDTRLHRMVSPTAHRFKQYIAGRRILRGQSTRLSRELAVKSGPQLLHMIDLGTAVASLDQRGSLTYEQVQDLLDRWAGGKVKQADFGVGTEKIGHSPGENAPKVKRHGVPRRPPAEGSGSTGFKDDKE